MGCNTNQVELDYVKGLYEPSTMLKVAGGLNTAYILKLYNTLDPKTMKNEGLKPPMYGL